MSYKAIGFDYGGVLAGQPASNFVRNVLKILDIDLETYSKTYAKYKYAVNRSQMTWPEMWQKLSNDIGKPEKLPKLLELSDSTNKDLLHLKPEILQLIDSLRDKGYLVGLLSNSSLENAKRWREQGLDNHFDVFHVSAETSYVKPDIEAFKHFATSLDVGLSELIFIDDSPVSLSTADKLGYAPILFTDYPSLITKLARLGVKLTS
jgi:HAD superfamily hydrolase (TIGR01509 family)